MAQPASGPRRCTAVLTAVFTGVVIRPGNPIVESGTADLTAVVNSRETALLESLAGRARTRVEQAEGYARAEAFRDGLYDAAAPARADARA